MSEQQLLDRIAKLERQVNRLEKRVGKLELERDEAMTQVVIAAQVAIIKKRGMYLRFGKWLLSDDIVSIKKGRMTVAEAIAHRDAEYPIFSAELGLQESYQEALTL